ncbi:MAG: type II toxin-antitoxin system RelE/ParE family toxin [Usitatibacter sp.]
MATLAYSRRALDDLLRLTAFLYKEDPQTGLTTIGLIQEALAILKDHPLVGSKARSGPARELVISRGRSGYLAQYVYDPEANVVLVLAIRHQREAGYQEA